MVRVGLSLSAVYIALVICSVHGHLNDVNFTNPSTYMLPFRHGCGLLLLVSALWAGWEAARLLRDISPGASG